MITQDKIEEVLKQIRNNFQVGDEAMVLVSYNKTRGLVKIRLSGLEAKYDGSVTLIKFGIEQAIKQEIAEVKKVEFI